MPAPEDPEDFKQVALPHTLSSTAGSRVDRRERVQSECHRATPVQIVRDSITSVVLRTRLIGGLDC